MTIEVHRTEARFIGLRKTTGKVELMDFRGWTEKKGSINSIHRPDELMLKGWIGEGKPHETEYVFANAISEDEIELRRGIGLTSDELKTPFAIYSQQEINDASLISEDGERIIWRPTEEGDYPPLMPEQIRFSQTW